MKPKQDAMQAGHERGQTLRRDDSDELDGGESNFDAQEIWARSTLTVAPASCQMAAPDIPRPGECVAKKYRIGEVLGVGGMGIVVEATHLQLGRRVAIKFLAAPENEHNLGRFLREARSAARLHSEHIAQVLDVGKLESGPPYIVMERLDGLDLRRRLKLDGGLPIQEAVDYLLQTCEGIAEAHAAGIIHRDLKPANLFLTRTPDGATCVKVLDFGISKTTDVDADGGMQLTRTETVIGSPAYMSPEQLISSKDVDPRSDIWSLGIILYQLLTGKVPFDARVLPSLTLKVSLDPPKPVDAYRRDVPRGLVDAILKCLEKKREDRFQSVAELAFAIADYGPASSRARAEKCQRVLGSVASVARLPSSTAVDDALAPPSAKRGMDIVKGAVVFGVGCLGTILVLGQVNGGRRGALLQLEHVTFPATAEPSVSRREGPSAAEATPNPLPAPSTASSGVNLTPKTSPSARSSAAPVSSTRDPSYADQPRTTGLGSLRNTMIRK